MRRKDKEITDADEIMSILEKADICRIALCDRDRPYVFPMNFGICGNNIFLHAAREGRKIDIIKENNNVCFEAETNIVSVDSDLVCDFGMKYFSVIGNGKAYIAENDDEKKKGLDCIVKKYSKNKDDVGYDEKMLEKVLIIRIEIENMTGKRS
jgi:uncharacterized protein